MRRLYRQHDIRMCGLFECVLFIDSEKFSALRMYDE